MPSAISNIFGLAGPLPAAQLALGQGAAEAGCFSAAFQAAATNRFRQATPDMARQSAQQLVASTLVLPLLEEMRKDPFRVAMFHGGQGEDMFQQQMNTVLADRIVQRTNLPVVGAVYRQILAQGKPAGAVAELKD